MMRLTDKEYLLRLDLALSPLPFEEREEAVEFVRELFVEALQEGDSTYSVIKSLGSPELYAQKILESFSSPMSPPPDKVPFSLSVKKSHSWWKIGLLTLVSIFLIPLVFGLLMVILGLLLSLFMVFLSLIVAFLSGILATFIVLGKGIYLIWHDPLGAFFDFGATLFGIGLTWLLGNLIHWIVKTAWPKTWCYLKDQKEFWSKKIRRIWI